MRMASIDISGMQALTSAMEKASTDLPSVKGALAGVCSSVQVQCKGGDGGLNRAIAFASEQLPGVRRRLAMAIALQEAEPGGFKPGVVRIDESKLSTLTPQEAEAKAKELADKIRNTYGDPSA